MCLKLYYMDWHLLEEGFTYANTKNVEQYYFLAYVKKVLKSDAKNLQNTVEIPLTVFEI